MAGSAHPPVRWGILGTGTIASSFATDLARVPQAELRAVGSRTQASADAFAGRFGIPVRHVGYRSLVEDSTLDVVYVALPHPWHHAWTRAALEAGRAVLCEKPFTVTAAEARDLVATARSRGRFLMEAMWNRFLPTLARVREILDDGALGEIRTVQADLGVQMTPDPASRLFAPELGGGALLDLGVYPVSFASFVLGAPQSVQAVATPTATGVDAQCSAILRYASGAHAVVHTTLEVNTPSGAVVAGTRGRIELSGPLYDPWSVRLVRGPNPGAEVLEELHHAGEPGHGWAREAAEVGRCLAAGLLESPRMPLDESVSIMETLDEIRRQIGLRYPFEAPGGD
ncbi:MAG: Gfo/Idh/MocA family protein [Candidatus Limnocylindrales bacterium]